jgi:dihydrodipicolinate synthase/N-acetylneuraminate lyase
MIFNSPVYPLSPSFKNEVLETESTLSYIKFLESGGVKTIMTTAGTSQFNLLSREEVRDFNCTTFNFLGKKIIGIPAISLKHLREEIVWYNSFGLENTYLLLLFPERYYTDNQVIEFFREACEISKYQILAHGNVMKRGYGGEFIYNYSLIESLSKIDGFVGMKEESPSLDFAIKNLSREFELEIIVAGGSMRRFWSLEPFGATTYLSGVGSFNPKIEEDFYRSYMDGNTTRAKDIMTRVEKPLFDVFMDIGWHTSMRYSLQKMGYIKGNRDPFFKLDENQKEILDRTLEKII